MEKLIIGVTFLLGVALTIVAIVALFRGGRTAGGSLELPGIKLTAKSASGLFLVVGAAMMLSGFAWASTNHQRVEVVREVVRLHEGYVKQVELNKALVERTTPAVINTLPPDKRALIGAPAPTLSPKIRDEAARLAPR